ncbi:MAG: GNAT family N-acetyltransferase [Candidatus Chisholmbacteria bacterium]|nr:GNAT family N-acetyltransferase [Candidatus Chisholmbacteria bacterium]
MIRLLTLADSSSYQNLKLQSLQTDPLAFLSSYEREKNFPLSYYQQKIHYTNLPPIFGIYGIFSSRNHNLVTSDGGRLSLRSHDSSEVESNHLKEAKLVGLAQLSQEYHLKKHHLANIYDVYIDPKLRHQGYAKQLLTHLIQTAKTYSVLEELQLWCNSRNLPAIKLYESLGFTLAATRLNAVKEPDGTYQDELQFSLSLKT